ncbi:hypothetical protein GALL_507290 [mine drainage metagenome]|uniref:Uncharacterized protein n=1 Tax=mine drainage metagenome TaxID=410659 RepID=A0A1J5P7Y7_9ZZZZ
MKGPSDPPEERPDRREGLGVSSGPPSIGQKLGSVAREPFPGQVADITHTEKGKGLVEVAAVGTPGGGAVDPGIEEGCDHLLDRDRPRDDLAPCRGGGGADNSCYRNLPRRGDPGPGFGVDQDLRLRVTQLSPDLMGLHVYLDVAVRRQASEGRRSPGILAITGILGAL